MKDPRIVLHGIEHVPQQMVAFAGAHRWWVTAGVLLAGAGWAAAAGWWRQRAATALRDRVAFELVPAATFEAGPSELRWAAGQIASVRAACGPMPRRAVATRLRSTYTDNKMRTLLEGPARAESLLRMPGYADVEVIPAHTGGTRPKVPRIRFEGAPPVVSAPAATQPTGETA
ncbi:hypothetical protein [Streptomyces sp. RKAG293]|uniref:hypothetical protein n=1 Tax=Streptomyces sp. RKAG293 TaxID=2893403 RepID=UPI002033B3F1|nr:hypothetical protein [Streptomyces sp. RKAG293]MCM2424159.1 hypothetical protein [Streptomyces sp. RKAG293]